MPCRGIKGATTAEANTEEAILAATRELLGRLVEANSVGRDDLVSITFSCTKDLNATFPARVARELGFFHVPLLSSIEMDVPGALERCIRVVMLVNTDRRQDEMRHLYLHGARRLRPEFAVDAKRP